ncbi:DUF3047 domain-containing protein [Belnapia sp. T6]|uniref:DUF3047 domain-containing protein n=1 Tax=Belnapia mucosa TaxID=2804532 RepID=A0ABS1VC55_9PROT|nr:DUF3047 domain-containing protein [Belnapia mucosa]MBL6459257.1 DUF3047 domain-containing protein [Belnapia mucosa]
MRRLATPLTMTLLAGGAGPATPTTPLEAAGWHHAEWHGLTPARFRPLPEGGVAVEGRGEGSFVWRRVQGPAECLRWRWRVEAGPPPTDLTRASGDDRALAIAIGFAGWPARVSFWQRSQHAIAQAAAGSHPLPRSALLYVWGGTGREPPHFQSPHMAGLGMVRVLRPATTAHGRWFEEQVNLAADWRAAFGADPPPLQELVVGTDADDTRSRTEAQVEGFRFGPCR